MTAPVFVLVLNAGSSSLKFQVLDPPAALRHRCGHLERIGTDGIPARVARD